MGFFEYDEEMMVAVISHELAHSLGTYHTQTKLYGYLFVVLSGTFGLGIDMAIFMLSGHASHAFTEAFTDAGIKAGREIGERNSEPQANYIGLHIMAMAGYEIERASVLWQRLAIKPEAKSMVPRHSISTKRISEIDDTIKKVKAERLENILLIRD